MKNKILIQGCMLALSVCLTTIHLAGQQRCQLPKLPISPSAQNIFSEIQEMDLGDAVAQHLQHAHSVIDQKAKIFGRQATVSAVSNLLCVENEEGLLNLYELASFEKRAQYTFPTRISFVRFSEDGKRLFVLTANQTVYVLDLSSLLAPSQPA